MKLELKQNEKQYWEFIRILRSDKKVQSGFIQNSNISKTEQEVYMEKYNNNYYICLCDDKPCGFIGEIYGDIRVCTNPDHQGKGVGSFMIREITKLRPNIYAKVKLDNISSIKAFEKASGQKLNYKIVGRRNGDITSAYADTTIANRELNWKTEKSLEEALAAAWNWQLQQ
jgi:RimJ/RimL family protein N-acetyltransferase